MTDTRSDCRKAFEAWMMREAANALMLRHCDEPGYRDNYEHPWTRGAWEAWKECRQEMAIAIDLLRSVYDAVPICQDDGKSIYLDARWLRNAKATIGKFTPQ